METTVLCHQYDCKYNKNGLCDCAIIVIDECGCLDFALPEDE